MTIDTNFVFSVFFLNIKCISFYSYLAVNNGEIGFYLILQIKKLTNHVYKLRNSHCILLIVILETIKHKERKLN